MIQGKLATDQIEDEDDKNEVKEEGAEGPLPDDMPMEDEKSNEDEDADKLNEEKLERTQA